MTTWVDVVNAALMRIGAQPLQAEGPGAAERQVVYDSVVGSIIGGYPWTFARRTRRLVRFTHVPEAHYRYAYATDPEMIGPPRAAYDNADCRRPFWEWELFAGNGPFREVHTNAEQIWLRYTIMAKPDAWPADVAEMIRMALMAEFALSVREDNGLYDKLRRIVYGPPDAPGEGGLIAQCKAKDSMGEPSPEIAGGYNPLVDVRRVSGGPRIGGWNEW